jgi:hypothetical protein
MKRYIRLTTIISLLALLFTISGAALAQEVTANLNGSVKDITGALVKGAIVTLTDTDKKVVVRTLTTGDEGEWTAPNLLAGNYSISIEAPGFKKVVQGEIKLDVGQRRTVDMTLEAGNITETVMVQTDPVAVELTTATTSTLVNGAQARELSLNNRNWVQLVAISPGVSNDLSDQVYVGTTNPEGQANTVNLAVNGARSSQNTFTVDGADITDRGSNITIQAYPSVDSIGEFRVLRSLFPAESGRSGGGQVNVITRSGGDKFHGSAYEFIRNEAFNANNFLSNAVTNPQFGRDENGKAKRAPFRYNNYGWTLSGPVYFPRFGEGGPAVARMDRTFFFFSQEFRKDRRFSAPITTVVPDAGLRNLVFPIDVCINRNNVASENCNVGNPGRLPAGTPLPAGFLNVTAAGYLEGIYKRLPLPNAAAPGAPYNLNAALPGVADFRQEIIKIDHTFSTNWSGYYRFQKDAIPTIDANGLFSTGTNLPGVSTTETDSPGKTHTAQTTYVVSPNLILEGRYAYGWGAILSHNVGLLALANTTVPVNLPFANQRDRIPTISNAAATPLINGFTNLTGFGPYDNFSYKHNFSGSATWIFGSHTTKFGGTYSVYRKNENALAGVNEGRFELFGNTVASGVANSALNQNLQKFANFLVGNLGQFSQARFDFTGDLRQKAFEAFWQDEWKARPNLTVYYGVRYSWFPSPYDKNGQLANFDPAFFNPAQAPQVTGAGTRVAGTGNFCNGIIVNEQNFQTGPASFNCTPTVSPFGKYVIKNPNKDFAPRFGIAWDPWGTGKTSIRAGYGVYHEQVLVGTFLQNIGTNPPYQETVSTTSNTRLDNPVTATSVGGAQSLRAVQSDWHTPYMQHWSLDIQHQVRNNTIFTIGYYGSKGTHLIGITELNSVAPGVALASNCINAFNQTVRCQTPGYVFRNAGSNTVLVPNNPNANQTNPALQNTDLLILDQLRPFRGYRSIAIIQPRYNSNYHSLQVSGQQRLTGSSQLNLAYTFSKNLTDSQNDRSAAPQDTYNTKAEYARAALDRRHVLSINYIYELPFFSKQNDLVGKLLGGWQASGIITYNSGLPFTVVTSNFDPAGSGIINANPTARPILLCDPNENAPHTATQWFNTACFQPNPANTADTAALGFQNVFGNTPRGIVEGPPTHRVDFTMSKNIRFTESSRLQLRAEVFNIFNHTNYRGFQSLNITGGTNFGRINSVRDPRTMQFGAKLEF